MNLPKGNPLFEEEQLSSNDIRQLTSNLKNNKNFVGYILYDLEDYSGSKCKVVVFYTEGLIKATIDMSSYPFRMSQENNVLNKFIYGKLKSVKVSAYLLPLRILNVMLNIHLFRENLKFADFTKAKFNEFLTKMKKESYYAIMEISARGTTHVLVMDNGEFVYNSLSDKCGLMILTNEKAIDDFISLVKNNGCKLSMMGASKADMEKTAQIVARMQACEAILSIKPESGIFASKDVKVDEDIYKKWTTSNNKKEIEIELVHFLGDPIAAVKCSPGKKLGSKYIVMSQDKIKQLNLQGIEKILVRPVLW